MKRWKAATWLLALGMACVCGCAQYFIREIDYDEFHRRNDLPRNLETNPAAGEGPVVPGNAPAPATVNYPERKPRYLSLDEAIAIALQQGMIGIQSVRSPGLIADDLVAFAGPISGVTGFDNIRVLALAPAITSTNIDRELARFDAQWTTSTSWTTTDEPVQGLASFTNGQAANVTSTLAKPLATGGVVGITASNDYRLLARPPSGTFSVLSPSYQPRLLLGFEQPLLRFGGVDTNQLIPSFPGSNLFSGVNNRRGAVGEGILISRIRGDQQRADFERAVHFQLLNVETAYWNLYGAYVSYFAIDQALNLAYQTWKVGKARYEEGKDDITVFAPTRGQYEGFRGDRLAALGAVLEAERNLRTLLGMPVEDGCRLVPVDAPTLAPYQPDWSAALQDCLNLRPELVLAREDIKARQLNLMTQLTFLKPDLRFQSSYQIVGLGSRLDGNGQFLDSTSTWRSNNALRSLASDHFNDWSIGLTLNVPLGYRAEAAFVRQARLQLAQSYYGLKEQEVKAQNYLAKQYRVVQEAYRTITARRQERLAYADELEGRFRKIAVGKATVDRFLLTAEQQWSTALSQEYQAVVAYNNALAAFEFARGTIMKYNNVMIAEGPLPQCVQVQAADHERERTRAIVLRERAQAPVLARQAQQSAAGLPLFPTHEAPPLPALFEAGDLLKKDPKLEMAAQAGETVGDRSSQTAATMPVLNVAPAPAALTVAPVPGAQPEAPLPLPPSMPASLPPVLDPRARLGAVASGPETTPAAGPNRPAALGGPLP